MTIKITIFKRRKRSLKQLRKDLSYFIKNPNFSKPMIDSLHILERLINHCNPLISLLSKGL